MLDHITHFTRARSYIRTIYKGMDNPRAGVERGADGRQGLESLITQRA